MAGMYGDILDKSDAEQIKELAEQNMELVEEIKELRGEVVLKDKRSIRDMSLFRQAREYILIIQGKLSDAEIAEAKQEFDEKERQYKAKIVEAKLEEEI